MQSINDIVDQFRTALLALIERGPTDAHQGHLSREAPQSAPRTDGSRSRPPRPSLKILSSTGASNLIRSTSALIDVAAKSQSKIFAAIVTFLEQPQRKLSLPDRQSLTSPLTRKTSGFRSAARKSISAPPLEQLQARIGTRRQSHVRVTSLQATTPISPMSSRDVAFMVPASPASSNRYSFGPRTVWGASTVSPAPTGIVFSNPFEQTPERTSTLAPMPVTELEVNPLLFRSKSVPASPEGNIHSPLDLPTPRKQRPVGLPFLQHLQGSGQNNLMTGFDFASPVGPDSNREPAVPHFLSSPLSDGPIPQPIPSFHKLPIEEANGTDSPRTPEDYRKHLALAEARRNLDYYSPFSAPECETSESYFALETNPPSSYVFLTNQQSSVESASHGSERPPSARKDSVISGDSNVSEYSSSTPKAQYMVPPATLSLQPAKPSGVSSDIPLGQRKQASPPSLPGLHPSSDRPATSALPSPDLARLSSDSAPARPTLPRISSEPDSTSMPSAAKTTETVQRVNPRKLVLSMASPADESEEALPQPSAWNDHLGFCAGAAMSQMDMPGAMVQSRTVQADMISHTVINFLKCSSSKCAFQGHGGAEKVWESSGVQYRRDFLIKSHCKQKKARTAIYTFQCIFCVLTRQKSPIVQGTESFMAHVATHRGQLLPPAVLKRTKCITGRTASSGEDFDINLPPLVDPSPISEPTRRTFFPTIEPDGAPQHRIFAFEGHQM